MINGDDIYPRSGATRLTPEMEAIGQGLRDYYQLASVGPTPQRLEMLMTELIRRVAVQENKRRRD